MSNLEKNKHKHKQIDNKQQLGYYLAGLIEGDGQLLNSALCAQY